ncbi:efflux RND transporter periplasmic adaptor subunit [soil metagenome]
MKPVLFLWPVLVIGCTGNTMPPAVTPPAICEVAHPVASTVTDYQTFTARTQAVQSVDIKPRVTGYITKIKFIDGDMVTTDQVLFEIDNRPYKAALDKSKADVEYAKANLVKTQAFYDIGIAVQKENKAAISQQELDRRKGGRDEAIAQVKQAEAALESSQLNFDWCTVKSPMNGRANRHLVDIGALVSENMTTLTNIVSLTPMWAYFDVDQNSALKYQMLVKEGKVPSARGNSIPVQMALAQDQLFSIAGYTDFVANQLDPNTGSIRMRGVFDNAGGTIAAGLFARIRVPANTPHEALLITDRAIGTDQGQHFVLVLNAKNEVEYRAVELGQMHEGLREVMRTRRIIEQGPNGTQVTKDVEVLKPDDRVIVNGLQRVRPGEVAEPKLIDMKSFLPKK